MLTLSSIRNNILLLILLILIPVGFLTKWPSLHHPLWINNSLGGTFYVLFWILAFKFINPKWKLLYISILVVLITSALEFTQLLKTPFLETVRSTFIGRTLIRTSFNLSDFIYYAIGGFLGFVILRNIDEKNLIFDNVTFSDHHSAKKVKKISLLKELMILFSLWIGG